MRLQSRSYSKINLINLLSKRKKTLKIFLKEVGITTYELLKNRCQTMGVQPPTEEEFNQAIGNHGLPDVSSPAEGVIVLTPAVEVEPQTNESTEVFNIQQQLQVVDKQTLKKKKIVTS